MLKIVRNNNKKFFIFFIVFTLCFSLINISTIADDPSLPDLIPDSLETSEPWEEGKEVEIIFKIKNIGTKNITVEDGPIEVRLLHGQEEVKTNSTLQDLEIDETCYVNISWTPNIGDGELHNFIIDINYYETIEESDTSNNDLMFQVKIDEKSTDLEIVNVTTPDTFVVGETEEIFTTIRNNGQDTDEAIYVKLNSSEEGEIGTVVKQDGLDRNETYNFSFSWTPSHFGSQSLSVDVGNVSTSHDVEEIPVNVGVGQLDWLDWWNESWHYRYFLTVNGSGNALQSLNFTEELGNLSVFSENFENDTIRIIKYSNDGTVSDEADFYKFNENTPGYNSTNNATGTLIWNVPENSHEKYYCIYFDVETNPGDRTPIEENETINASGNASTSLGFVDGWEVKIQEPIDGDYTFIIDPINISVRTDAKAESVTAFVFLTDNESHGSTLNLTDIENQTSWIYNDFSDLDYEGNWTIRVTSVDNAGYIPLIVEHDLFVGKPDLELVDISYSTNIDSSGIVYKNDTVNITANVVSHDATIEDVNISLSIIDMSDDQQVFSNNISLKLVKGEITQVYFNWKTNSSGDFKIIVTVDPSNKVNESDESNNERNLALTVHGLPDLAVKDIILPSGTTMEFDKVKIDVVVENKGLGNASNYVIKLFIKRAPSTGLRIMDWLNDNAKDNETISVNANSSETVSLYWDSAKTGVWMVGAKIFIGSGQRDSEKINDKKLSTTDLIIRSYEKNKPNISDITINPIVQEQGGSVTITAKVTDDSGLESVKIIITDPNNYSYPDENMIRKSEDIFKFVFTDTFEVGKHKLIIKAVDISIHKNPGSANDIFTIIEDETDPTISYYDAKPYVQLINDEVTISCIATDNTIIDKVTVTITPPKDVEYIKTMELSSNGKYEHTDTYDIGGKYTYQILVIDGAGNWVKTDEDIFWVTRNKDDTDNDGMLDDWEKRYNLDPEDPTDADKDMDGDGYTNLKEYQIGTHPGKDIFLQNVAYRVKENAWYLVGSIVLFLVILLLAKYGKRRKKT